MIFLTAGHNDKDPGAVANGRKEAEETKILRNGIAKVLNEKGVGVWKDLDEWDLNRTISEIKKLSKPNDIICDIHFNAGSSAASGCEVFVSDNADIVERNIANDLVNNISSLLMIRKRGVKTESQSQHRKLGMMRPVGRNVLIEVCFITSKFDMGQYDSYFGFLCEKIADVLIKYNSKGKE